MPEELQTITKTTSRQFTLNLRDLLRGGLLTVITAVLTYAQTALADGNFVFKWKPVATVATITLIGYLLKNFFEPAQTIIKITPPPKTEPCSGAHNMARLA